MMSELWIHRESAW